MTKNGLDECFARLESFQTVWFRRIRGYAVRRVTLVESAHDYDMGGVIPVYCNVSQASSIPTATIQICLSHPATSSSANPVRGGISRNHDVGSCPQERKPKAESRNQNHGFQNGTTADRVDRKICKLASHILQLSVVKRRRVARNTTKLEGIVLFLATLSRTIHY